MTKVAGVSTVTLDHETGEMLEYNPKVWNSMNARHRPHRKAVNKLPSMTIPDQTMSLREIMDRYTHGILPTGTKQEPVYDEDGTTLGINPRKLDLVDQQDIADEISETIDKAKNEDRGFKKEREDKLNEEVKNLRADAEKRAKEHIENPKD